MLRFTTAGESHGRALVAIVEGMPAGLPVDQSLIDQELRRRQLGYGRGGRMKIEKDHAEILNGVRHGLTLGSPITLLIENKDWPNWTDVMSSTPIEIAPEKSRRLKRPRPGHADLAGGLKYDVRDLRNILERASARETTARVACGALAKQLLGAFGVEIRSHVIQLGGIPDEPLELSWTEIAGIPDDGPLHCADAAAEQRMIALIDETRTKGDTLGGVFEVVARGIVPGLGSHTSWDSKLDGRLAQAVMSIPAVKAVAIGAGAEISSLPGSEVHDEIAYNSETREFIRETNRAGGLLGRRIELVVEEESSPKDTVERFRKLILQNKVDIVSGAVSTGVGLALGPVAEELKTLWLAWDATTQKGVEETIPKPKYSFRSCDNECEAVMASILTARAYKGKIKTVAGINNDYSYGRDNWAAFLAIMKKYGMEVTPVADLWPKLGTTDFTSHVATLQQAKPDLIFSSFWSGDAPILLKQAHAAGLTAAAKFVMTTAGGVHESLKKAFTPENILVGYNTMYFEAPQASPLLREFVKWHHDRFKEWPNYESDHAYFTIVAYKAAVEKAAQAAGGKWPTTDQIIGALETVEVESLSGKRRYREDHIMEASFFQGFSTYKNAYDFVTIRPVEVMSTKQIQKPSGVGLYDWINGWKV